MDIYKNGTRGVTGGGGGGHSRHLKSHLIDKHGYSPKLTISHSNTP